MKRREYVQVWICCVGVGNNSEKRLGIKSLGDDKIGNDRKY